MNPQSASQQRHSYDVFVELFEASFWSSVFVTILSLLIIGSVSVSIIRSNILQGDNISFAHTVGEAPLNNLQQQATVLGTSHSAAVLSLFLFWGIVGMMAYFAVMGIKNVVGGAFELDQEIHYVHAKPKELVNTALTRFGVRLLVGAVWFLYAWVFAHLLLPYVLAAAGAASALFPAGLSFAYFLLAFVVVWISLHFHVVFARLMALRVRVFSDAPTD